MNHRVQAAGRGQILQARNDRPSSGSLREPTSQPFGHFGSCPPCHHTRGCAAPSPASRGEVSGQDIEPEEEGLGWWRACVLRSWR
jgi:hypothetical protein